MTHISYEHKRFRPRVNSDLVGDVDDSTVFEYREAGSLVWATYSGGAIDRGTLLAKKFPDGSLDMRYQHFTKDGVFKAGECTTIPVIEPDGRLILHETWKWLEGDAGSGTSTLEEIR